jgi:hypothetical protein
VIWFISPDFLNREAHPSSNGAQCITLKTEMEQFFTDETERKVEKRNQRSKSRASEPLSQISFHLIPDHQLLSPNLLLFPLPASLAFIMMGGH